MKTDRNLANGPEMPMGLGMALAKNLEAMNRFASLPYEKQQAIIEHTHQIGSKKEMEQFVGSIAKGSAF